MKIKIFFLFALALVSCTSGQKTADFVSAENRMNDSISVITLKNNGIYDQIEETFSKSPKLSMIKITDGEDSPAIDGKEIDMAKVPRLNNISIPSVFMLEPDEDGKAYYVKALFADYISFLNELVQNDQVTKDKINGAIDFSDHKSTGTKKSEANQNWVIYTFKGKTLGQTINTLSLLQFETRKLESETLLFLIRNIPADN
ncbi:MAG: hypothetical protein MUF36_12820 [Bacteroidales bacterium]|nr:hypothetical protein [Bacteroidales bacterium]